MAFDPLSPETVYSLKGNVAIPPESPATAASTATAAGARVADAFTNPLAFSGVAAPTVTIAAGQPIKANR